MSRRHGAKPSSIQMFPFLDALTCTMGALVVILHAFAERGQQEVDKVAQAKASAQATQARLDLEDAQWQIKNLQEARSKTAAQLTDERLKLSHVEDHARRLREKLGQLKIAAAELDRAASDKTKQREQGAAELAELKAKVEAAKQAVQTALRDGKHNSVSYSVVPYEGRNATQRQPVYIECRENLIVLQPEGIELSPRDFIGFFGPGNPLAAAVRAKREYLANQATPSSSDEPYPLLLVRPEGIAAYYAARAALDSYGSDFGYELIGSDWTLKFPQPDPRLIAVTRTAVAEARLRHREFALNSPRVARSRPRPVYHARSHGGFAAVGGGGGGEGPGGRARGGWDEMAGDWASGDDGPGGGDPRGNSAVGSGNRSKAHGFPGDGVSDDLPPAGEMGAGGDGFSGRGFSDAGSPGGGGELRDPYADTNGSRTGSGGMNPDGTSRSGARNANPDGTAQDDAAPHGYPDGGGDTGKGQADRTGTATSANRDPRYAEAGGPRGQGANRESSGGTGGTGKYRDGSNQNQNTANGKRPPAGATAGGDSPGAAGAEGDPSQASGGNPASALHAGTPPSPNAPKGHGKPTSIASKRGADWGLLESSVGAVGATRPVMVEVFPDRLIVLSEARGVPGREIRLGARTEDSIDELVSSVWDQTNTWGKAGRGMYWKPTLSMNVQPGAAERFTDLQALLADSGLDVHQRTRSAAPTTTPKRR